MMQNVLTPRESKIAITSIMIYITIYSFEAPIRYVLALTGLTELILLRDLLIIIPLALIFMRQLFERQIHPVLMIFALVITVQCITFYLNFHVLLPALLGAKLVINIALGMLVGALLINCSGRVFTAFLILFWVSCLGVYVEKTTGQFPWVGMSVVVGGVETTVSMDWGGTNLFNRRVGGFTRLSITVAGLMPIFACILVPKLRHYGWRALTLLVTIGGVFMTTQKGALVATVLVALSLSLPYIRLRLAALRLVALAGGAIQIILPFATAGMPISEGTGDVYSASSFAARVIYTWPESLRHIADNSVGIFGSGLGSLGSPMRVLIPAATWMFADNMFIFMYGSFGIFTLLVYWAVVQAIWRSLSLPPNVTESALAILALILWYGAVVSIIEDQLMTLALGASLGTLLLAKTVPVTLPAMPIVGRRLAHE